MLTDEQIDELEHFIFNSTTQDLPVVLGKALPLLFAELRVVRATLDSKVSTFLGEVEVGHDRVREGGGSPLCGGRTDSAGSDGDHESADREREIAESSDELHRDEDGGKDVRVTREDKGVDGGDTEVVDTQPGRKKVGGTPRKQPRKTRRSSKPTAPLEDLPDLT